MQHRHAASPRQGSPCALVAGSTLHRRGALVARSANAGGSSASSGHGGALQDWRGEAWVQTVKAPAKQGIAKRPSAAVSQEPINSDSFAVQAQDRQDHSRPWAAQAEPAQAPPAQRSRALPVRRTRPAPSAAPAAAPPSFLMLTQISPASLVPVRVVSGTRVSRRPSSNTCGGEEEGEGSRAGLGLGRPPMGASVSHPLSTAGRQGWSRKGAAGEETNPERAVEGLRGPRLRAPAAATCCPRPCGRPSAGGCGRTPGREGRVGGRDGGGR